MSPRETPLQQALHLRADVDRFVVRIGPLTRILVGVTLFLILASTAGQLLRYRFGYETAYGLIPLFFVGQERNVPTYYSSLLLLCAAVLLGVIGLTRRRLRLPYSRHWTALALIFVLLSLDEVAGMHEMMIRPMREALHVGSFLYFAWVIPGGMLVLVIGGIYLRFFLALAPRFQRLFGAAAFLYVGGALGVEMLGGRHADLYGLENLSYRMYQTVEESFEMFGMVLFIHALLRYFAHDVPHGPFYIDVRE
jgi:hypothetical protein